jgi:hypothetical protein
LWENSPQLQRFEASQYEPPGQKEMGMPNLPQNLCGKVSLLFVNRFSMFGPGCSVPETLSTNTTWIVTCTTAMFALDVIVQDIFLVECAATNVTFILLNIGVVNIHLLVSAIH